MHQPHNPDVFVLLQSDKLLVSLGESVRDLARALADFLRCFDAECFKRGDELGRAGQRLLVVPGNGDEFQPLVHFVIERLLGAFDIELEDRVAEHRQGDVDQLNFPLRVDSDLLLENLEALLVVVVAVLHQTRSLVLRDILGARAFDILKPADLAADAVELADRVERSLGHVGVQTARHLHRAETPPGLDAQVPLGNRPVKEVVVRKQVVLRPVDRLERFLDGLAAPVALGLLGADLDRAAMNLELRVHDVGRRVVDLGPQTILAVVVCFKVDGDDFIQVKLHSGSSSSL